MCKLVYIVRITISGYFAGDSILSDSLVGRSSWRSKCTHEAVVFKEISVVCRGVKMLDWYGKPEIRLARFQWILSHPWIRNGRCN